MNESIPEPSWFSDPSHDHGPAEHGPAICWECHVEYATTAHMPNCPNGIPQEVAA